MVPVVDGCPAACGRAVRVSRTLRCPLRGLSKPARGRPTTPGRRLPPVRTTIVRATPRALAAGLLRRAPAGAPARPAPAPATPPVVAGVLRPRRARSTSSPRTTRSCRTRSTSCPARRSLLHVINGGLEVHEAIIGDASGAGRLGGRRGRHRRRPTRPDPAGQRAARRGRASASSSTRASASTSSGPCRPTRRAGRMGRRLPHPGPLGARHAGPRSGGWRASG